LLEYETKKQAEIKSSNYIGKVNDKIEIELTIKKRIAYETNYTYYGGTSYIYIMEDKTGNQYKWNTAKCLYKQVGRYEEVIQDGETIKLKGSIKEHAEYNEVKQTVLTRCKLV
jgi:hypothetical protein